ncbi:neuroblast differentiation-associated protein AHNAK [Plectropomus leopardus]|uniref:neuroblast differentiation-associated protein AHNAK n=1 Tax=Plectropomus leopardus TaxID=160734 RepID=UPI001C4BFFF9|nr:neuroblast differentiation-associated protein AHNAK [Plectropomus leopardus]
MSGDSTGRHFSESLVLDDSESGVIITGITDDTMAAKSGLQAGDEIVAATIHLDHLNKNEVLNILKVLEPYDNNMKVLTKKELVASAGLGSLGLGLKDPAQMLDLKKDLSLDASAEAPDLSINGLSGKLNAAQGLGGEIGGPTLNGDLPSLSLNTPSADAGAKFTMPDLGLTGSGVKRDLDGSLEAPDVSFSAPKLNTPSASLDVEKPEIKTGNLKYKAPKFKMPNFNLPHVKTSKPDLDASGDVDLPSVSGNLGTPDLNVTAPAFDFKTPDLDLSGPKVDLNGPGLNVEPPNADIEVPSVKRKWPHQNWKLPKVKGPDADLNAGLPATDVNLTTPKIDGNLSTPDIDIKSPDLAIQTPNLDIDAPSNKTKWNWKLKKPKLPGLKSDLDLDANLNTPSVDASLPTLEGAVNTPDVDINAPKADFKGPDLDVQTPNIDAEAPSGKIPWPHLKWKKPKLQGPKADLNADLNCDTNLPNAELSLPTAELNSPNVDVESPDLNINAPSGKHQWLPQWWKKPKLHGPKVDADLNTDLSAPDVDVSLPKMSNEIGTPDVDVTLPKADVDVKALDIDTPSTKLRFPTLKKPKFAFPTSKLKGTDVDLDAGVKAPDLSVSPPSLDGPDIDVNLPKADVDVNAPNVDIKAPSVKSKWPTFKKWSISGPKINGPDAGLDTNVSAPELNLQAPTINGEMNPPDVNLDLPKTNLEGPVVDIDTPDIESPSGKINKWFNFKIPKFGTLKGPKGNIDADVKVPDTPDFKAPGVDLSAPELSAPKIEGGIGTPDINIGMPNADVKGLDVDVNGPDIDPDIDLKFPKIKLPALKGPKVKAPKLDADLKTPDIDAKLDLPKGNVDIPNADIDSSNLSVSAPKIGLDAPDLDVSLPKVDGLNVDLRTQEVDASAGKLRLPKIPGFGLSRPNLNVDAHDVKAPNLNLSGPTINGDVSSPDIDLGADLKTDLGLSTPKTNITVPDIDVSTLKIDGPSLDLTKADIQVPDANVTAPDLSLSSPTIDGTLPALNIDTKLPNAELKAPVTLNTPNVISNVPTADLKQPDVQFKKPDLELDSHLGDINLPHYKLPKFGLSSPDADVPNINPSVETGIKAPEVNLGTPSVDTNISVPAVDVSVPNLEGDIKGPEAPTVDANLEKPRLSNFKFPKFSFPGSKIKAPEVDTSANLEVSPDMKVKAPSIDGDINLPDVGVLKSPEVKTSLNTPELDIKPDADVEVKGSPKSKRRWPFRWGFKSGSGTDEEGSGADSENDASKAEMEVPVFRIHRLPRNSIDGIGEIGDTMGLLKSDTDEKEYVMSKGVRLPILNATPKTGEKIDIMERLMKAKEKAPSVNVSPTESKTDIDLKLPGLNVGSSAEAGDSSLTREGTFKVEKPESVLGISVPEISTSDENDKLSQGLSNMLGLNIKDSDAD